MNLTLRQNTRNRAISQYQSFFFDRGIAKIGNKTFGLKCDALCELGGNKDGGSNISASFQTGFIPFGDGRKRVRTIHVKGQFDSQKAIEVDYAMDNTSPSVSYEKASGSSLSSLGSLKFNGGRGKYGEHLSVLVSNVSGAKFHINSIIAFLVRGCRR